MRVHGNSNDNKKKHHLYAILDTEENDIFKYGISDKPIKDDGYSSRMKKQVNYLNRAVGWIRYLAKVIVLNIEDRRKAKALEDEHIETYTKRHGRRPRGNV